MLKQIIVYFDPAHTETVSWVPAQENHLISSKSTSGTLKELRTFAQDQEIIILVTGQDVLLTLAQMPKLPPHKLRQAVPYALEDQVLEDIQELHFAISLQREDNSLPVGIISKKTLEDWINLFKNYDLNIVAIAPTPLIVPFINKQWQCLVYQQIAIIRTGLHSGFACELNNLNDMLKFKLHEEQEKPDSINIRNYTSIPLALDLNATDVYEKNIEAQYFIKDLCAWYTTNADVLNLLQNNFRPKQKTMPSKKLWKFAGILLASWIGLLFFTNIISFFLLESPYTTLENQIHKIYRENFPEATSMVNPKERMTQKLHNLITQGDKNPFILWLAIVAKNSANFPEIHITQLEYHNAQLVLNIATNDFANLDKFTKALASSGLTVKQQDITTIDKGVKGSLVLTGGGHT